MALSSSAVAAQSSPPINSDNSALTPTQVTEQPDYRNSSDAELTQLVRNWAQLSPTERRLLLSEVRTRMKHANAQGNSEGGAKAPQPQADLNRVLAQKTYGRTVQRPDGSVVTETQTIKITPQGRQVTRQTTIRPPANSNPNLAAAGEVGQVAVDPTMGKPPRRVMRTKIRFGAGFERRQGAVENPEAQQSAAESSAAKSSPQPGDSTPQAKSESPQR
ncbi:MAG: hypothetical protein ACPGXJ_02900 [Pseudomonadales bacterium]